MAEGLHALSAYGSDDSNDDSNANEDDGGSGGYPSQGDVDMHKKDDRIQAPLEQRFAWPAPPFVGGVCGGLISVHSARLAGRNDRSSSIVGLGHTIAK